MRRPVSETILCRNENAIRIGIVSINNNQRNGVLGSNLTSVVFYKWCSLTEVMTGHVGNYSASYVDLHLMDRLSNCKALRMLENFCETH